MRCKKACPIQTAFLGPMNYQDTALKTEVIGCRWINPSRQCRTMGALLEKRGIKRGELARHIDARFEVVDKWKNGEVAKLDLDVLARICYVLDCDVADILKSND